MQKFVAYLDILGFKELINSAPLSEVRKKLDYLISLLNQSAVSYNDSLDIIRFSDSIILISKTDSLADFDTLILCIMHIQTHAIQSEIPIKGSISFGEIIYEKEISLLLGKPVINAYLLQEEIKFIGVVIDSKAHEQLDRFLLTKNCKSKEYIIKGSIPTKSGKVLYNHLNYVSALLKLPNYTKIRVQTDIYQLYYKADLGARQYIDNTFEIFRGYLGI